MKSGGHNKLEKKEFSERAFKKFGNKFDYTHVEYKDVFTKVKIICPKHGEFLQTPQSHLRGKFGCLKCANNDQKKWTDDEEEFLIKNFDNLSRKEIMAHLGKNYNCLSGKIQRLGLKKKKKKKFPGMVWNNTKSGAKIKKLNIDITREFLQELLEKQNYICALTGVRLVSSTKSKENTVSVDRIDSSRGYTKNNVQIVHKLANLIKRDIDELEFYKICKNIANHLEKRYSKIEVVWDHMGDMEYPVRVFSETPTQEKDLHYYDNEGLFEDLF